MSLKFKLKNISCQTVKEQTKQPSTKPLYIDVVHHHKDEQNQQFDIDHINIIPLDHDFDQICDLRLLYLDH